LLEKIQFFSINFRRLANVWFEPVEKFPNPDLREAFRYPENHLFTNRG